MPNDDESDDASDDASEKFACGSNIGIGVSLRIGSGKWEIALPSFAKTPRQVTVS